MNALLRHKGPNARSNHIIQNFYKRYLRTNYCVCCATKHNAEQTSGRRAQILQNKKHPTVIETASISSFHVPLRYHHPYSSYGIRHLHVSRALHEASQSKVDATVKKLKNQQKEKVEEIMKEVANGQPATTTTAAATATSAAAGVMKESTKGSATAQVAVAEAAPNTIVKTKPKKPMQQVIWEEILHYYHGFRLLFIDVAISTKLLWRVLNGKTMTRRENKQLMRTTSDLFRLIPFSVFIVVPFMELLLPVFIKFFPGMLPSTFQTAKDRQERLRQSLGVRLEVAKFLQKTLGQMPVQHKEHKSQEAKDFEDFFRRIRSPNEYVGNEEIIKYAKRFDDEITLDSLSREQLAALCRVLELNTIGTTMLLRFQLRLKLRSLATDDRVIAREGVDSLDLFELQQACKARGMRAYGLTAERLRFQLKEWIDLSLNEQVPPTLLLLSRAMLISDDSITTDKLKETMRVLPDAVAAHTRHAIGEREGKVDNKTKIQVIQEEERRIKEERLEEQEEKIAKRSAIKEDIPAPYVYAEDLAKAKVLDSTLDCLDSKPEKEADGISSTDVQLLSDALKSLSTDKQLVVEKETIKELKEELRDYKDDVEELHEVRQVVKEPVRESRAAKLLYNRVNKMISQLDTVLHDLENRQAHIKKVETSGYSSVAAPRAEVVHIDELVATIRRMKESSDEERFKVVEDLMVKLDADKDGAISVHEITKVVQSIDSEATKIDKKQLEEFTDLLTKQASKRRHEEIVRIDDLMLNIKMLKETSDEARLKHIETVLDKFDADKDGVVTVNEIRKVLESLGRDNIKLSDKAIEELIALLDKEQILHAEQKIEKAIAKSIKEAEKLKAEVEKTDKEMAKLVDDIHDSAKEIQDIATELGALEKAEEKANQLVDKLNDTAKTLKDESALEKAKKKANLNVDELKDVAKGLKVEPAHKDMAKILKDNAKELNPQPPADDKPGSNAPNKRTPPKASGGTNQPFGGGEAPKMGTTNSTRGSGIPTSDAVIREAAERQIEKLLPTTEISVPPTIPTSPPSPSAKPKPPASTKATATVSTAALPQDSVKKVL
ncbi:mitochondrial proton/calcium exchanger protein [Scaptodrosophila lebanonensis]|uniref:Mitochondrial proton/calcium exchanger protein n=1 Tax=Drosophila lebanonensis TaxID=7225 RepID=A0A6J2TGG9_DROLE|nr:mitochondrial proton/calcium exchanger protein [Scaptodrosophila lebanonensis]